MSILFGLLSALFGSVGYTFRKKSVDNSTLPNGLFVLMSPFIGIVFIYILVYLMGINTDIFSDYKVIGLLLITGCIDRYASVLEAGLYKKIKVSKVLPYSSFDKLFIIVIGFILFYGNEGYTSIPTLITAIFTVAIIMLFSLDFKHLKIESSILFYILIKLLYAIATLIVGSILLSYTTIDVFSILILAYLLFHLTFNFLLKNNFKEIFKQTKKFYKYRITSSILGRTGFVLGFFIIETSGVLIASLLSFVSIVFSVISMKYILGDTPTKKQVILAILVVTLIGIGYSFK